MDRSPTLKQAVLRTDEKSHNEKHTTIGLNVTGNVFQVRGVDADGVAVVRQRLTRGVLHRVRLILNRQCTQLSNAMRAHLAEFGIAKPIGRNGIEQLLGVIADPTDERVSADARFCLETLEAQLRIVKEQILENDRRILASARETELGRRLMGIPDVGPLLASAIVATLPDAAMFRSGCNCLLDGRRRSPQSCSPTRTPA